MHFDYILVHYIYSTFQHLSDTQFRYLKWKILFKNRILILYNWDKRLITVCWTDHQTILPKSRMPTPSIHERPYLLCNLQARSMLIHLIYEIVFYQNNGSMGRSRHYVGTCSGTYHVIHHRSRDKVLVRDRAVDCNYVIKRYKKQTELINSSRIR